MKRIFILILLGYTLNSFCCSDDRRVQDFLCQVVKCQAHSYLRRLVIDDDTRSVINLPGSDGEPALHWAAITGDTESVDILLKNGANANQLDDDGDTPLHSAAISGSVEIAQMLIDHEAKTTINHPDRHGYVALHSAAFNNNVGVLNILLQNGALTTINHPAKNGLTPLGAAREKGNDDAVVLLRSYGATE